ncbi:MAG: hypothetical protein ACREHV_01600 [Rhizomicrobium sp.]
MQTTGDGVEAQNIVVGAAFSSPGGSSLNLLANDAITINAHVTIGTGGQLSALELGSQAQGEILGAISCGPQGRISFDSVSDQFNINGVVAALVESLPDLASAISSNPGGFYVLANNYDAGTDGTYRSSPVGTTFTGYFEALGNTISHVKINDQSDESVGLFAEIDGSAGFGTVRNLRLESASVKGGASRLGAIVGYVAPGAAVSQSSSTGMVNGGDDSEPGGLVGYNYGTIVSSWSSAQVTGGSDDFIGGLAGNSNGTISNSFATGSVASGLNAFVGGLVGETSGMVSNSFAAGAVQTAGGGYAGGLIGGNAAAVKDCYALGSVADAGGGDSGLGGLVGFSAEGVSDSYSTGTVRGTESDEVGGLVGDDDSGGGFHDAYWDVSTSGVSQGAGNIADDPGITGLTTKQLRSGLPEGFEKSVWKEKTNVNRGFPYLITNPPPK